MDRSIVPHIGNVIVKSTSVIGFNLADNSLGPRGAEALSGHLVSCHRITFLE